MYVGKAIAGGEIARRRRALVEAAGAVTADACGRKP
jgi:hypothetical protein